MNGCEAMSTRAATVRAYWSAAAVCASALLSACGPPADAGWAGYAEGEYVYVAAPIAGALATLAVQRGDEVKRGAPLFVLDAESERAAREEAAARLQSAGAQAADLEKGKRAQELAVIDAQLAQARALAAQAAAELKRQEGLVAQGFVSASRLDDVRAAARQASARVVELEASLGVARMPARADERAAAGASTEAARFALEQARWRETQKRQTAPADARVADTFFRPGEWVGAGQPVVSLLPPGATKARFYVPEGELGGVAVGDRVDLRCDGCSAPVPARISFIATQAEYTPPVIYSNTQRSRLVFMVEARPESDAGARLRPGQPLDARRVAGGRP
ncbi:MAG: HlyD family secretion protein [Caldimonas sp.]